MKIYAYSGACLLYEKMLIVLLYDAMASYKRYSAGEDINGMATREMSVHARNLRRRAITTRVRRNSRVVVLSIMQRV